MDEKWVGSVRKRPLTQVTIFAVIFERAWANADSFHPALRIVSDRGGNVVVVAVVSSVAVAVVISFPVAVISSVAVAVVFSVAVASCSDQCRRLLLNGQTQDHRNHEGDHVPCLLVASFSGS